MILLFSVKHDNYVDIWCINVLVSDTDTDTYCKVIFSYSNFHMGFANELDCMLFPGHLSLCSIS